MPTPTEFVFLAVVAFVAVHELDAVQRHEWRFFFRPFEVSDETAYRLFTALHLPLFVVVFWGLQTPSFRLAFDVFAVAHAGLHVALRDHPLVEFDSRFSWLWIAGAAGLGALHLLLVLAV